MSIKDTIDHLKPRGLILEKSTATIFGYQRKLCWGFSKPYTGTSTSEKRKHFIRWTPSNSIVIGATLDFISILLGTINHSSSRGKASAAAPNALIKRIAFSFRAEVFQDRHWECSRCSMDLCFIYHKPKLQNPEHAMSGISVSASASEQKMDAPLGGIDQVLLINCF